MKKITIIRIAALLGLAGCAFKTPEENTVNADLGTPKETKPFASHSTALESLAYGPWQGKLPCADCEGIVYQLTLQKDRTYEESSEYLGKNAKPFMEKGTWLITQDTTVILTKPTGQTQFRLSKGSLFMIDQQGQVISSAQAENYRLNRVGAKGNNTNNINAAWENKRNQGIDFIAMGNEPGWSLDIDLDKVLTFQSQNGRLKLSAPVPSEQKLPEGKGSVYRARTEAGTLTVRILNQPCTDNMSGQSFPYTVEVTANAQDYRGCGQYLENYVLNDIWALQEMNGKAVNAANLTKGVPTLELQLKPKKVLGHSGCNQLSGGLEVKGNKITIGALTSTRMACPGPAMTFEQEYLNLLSNKTFTYALEDNRLKFLENNKVVLVYKKAD